MDAIDLTIAGYLGDGMGQNNLKDHKRRETCSGRPPRRCRVGATDVGTRALFGLGQFLSADELVGRLWKRHIPSWARARHFLLQRDAALASISRPPIFARRYQKMGARLCITGLRPRRRCWLRDELRSRPGCLRSATNGR